MSEWLPWGPLWEQLGCPGPSVMAWRLGVSKGTVYRWRRLGGVPVGVADRVAVAAGLHPGVGVARMVGAGPRRG